MRSSRQALDLVVMPGKVLEEVRWVGTGCRAGLREPRENFVPARVEVGNGPAQAPHERPRISPVFFSSSSDLSVCVGGVTTTSPRQEIVR